MSKLLPYVQAAARRGWHVFPLHRLNAAGHCTCQFGEDCKSAAKHPLHEGWRKAPDLTPEVIARTWGGDIAPNYGIRTGAGMLVLDEDPDKGGDIHDLLVDLGDDGEEILNTFTVRTGSGGRHFYLALPEGMVLGNSSGKLGVGIDTRGDGGYVVGPGSVSSKGAYTVVMDDDVAPAPQSLLDRLVTKVRPDVQSTTVPLDVNPARTAYVRRAVERELERLDTMQNAAVAGDWERGYRGEPWDGATYAVACNLIELANTGAGPDMAAMHALFLEHAPVDKDFVSGNHEEKWASAAKKVGANCRNLAHVGASSTGYGGDVQDAFADPSGLKGAKAPPKVDEHTATDRAERFAVNVGDRDDAALYDETVTALLAYDQADPKLFRSGGEMALLDTGTWKLQPLSVHAMREVAARRVAFYAMKPIETGSKEKIARPSSAPKALHEMLLARVDVRFPECSAISETGFFTPEGQWWDQRGYCEAAATYCTGVVRSSAIPERPSQLDAENAVQRLLEPLAGFPFADEASRAHALGTMLLPFVRSMISGPTPMHLIQASAAGTGKTKLAETLLHPACGDIAVNDTPGRRDEVVKTVFSALRMAPRALVLDNIPEESTFGAGELASMLTSYPQHSARVLGTSTLATVPTTNAWVATGNNPAVTNEMARRMVVTELEAGENVLDREFAIEDLATWMADHRGSMIAACATVVRAWIVAGRPAYTGRRLASYESWSTVVGGILEFAGVAGFMANQRDVARRNDVQGEALLEFLDGWAHMTDAQGQLEARQTTSALLAMAEERDIEIPGLNGRNDHGRRSSLGRWIKRTMVGKTLPSGYGVEAIRFPGGVANGFVLSQGRNVVELPKQVG